MRLGSAKPAYLSLELLELLILRLLVCVNLLLRFVSGLLYTLCAVYPSQLSIVVLAVFKLPHIL